MCWDVCLLSSTLPCSLNPFQFLHLGALAVHPASSGGAVLGSLAGVQPSTQSAAVTQPFPYPTENPFHFHSPAHYPRADLAVFQLGKHPLPVSPRIPAVPEDCCLVRDILRRDGVEVEAVMGWCLGCVCPGHTAAVSPACWAAGWECSHAQTPLSICKCGKTRVRAPTVGRGRQQRNRRVLRSSHTVPALTHGCSAQGARLFTNTLAPGCVWPHTPPCSPNPAPRT